MYRHLSAPPNACKIKLINPFLTVFKEQLKTNFMLALPPYFEGWRTGKKLVKLAMIDRSYQYDTPHYERAKTFVKKEAGLSVPTKGRLIQGNLNELTAYEYPDEYTAISKALQAIGQREFEYDGINFQFRYTAGMNHAEMATAFSDVWLNRLPNSYIDERDGKNWDSTMNKRLLMSEYLVYEMLGLRAANSFLKRSAGVKGVINCKTDRLTNCVIKYITRWKRLSGDWNTSVGNSIVSMIIIFTVICSLPTHLRPVKVFGMFMGDDYLGVYQYANAICPRMLTSALNDLESDCGITPVRALFDDPLYVSYISLGLWPRRDGSYAMVPHPGRTLGKLFWSVTLVPPNVFKEYRSEIARSFEPTYRGFEFVTRFLRHHVIAGLQLTDAMRRLLFVHHHWMIRHDLVDDAQGINWQYGFLCKYGFPITALVWTDGLPEAGMVYHPLVTRMIELEALDPCDREQRLC